MDPVVLLGSGATIPLGYPGWRELAAIFAQITGKQYAALETGVSEGAEQLARELWFLVYGEHEMPSRGKYHLNLSSEQSKKLEDVNSLMDLCEEFLDRMGTEPKTGKTYLHLARLEFAKVFRANGPNMLMLRLRLLLNEHCGGRDREQNTGRSALIDFEELPEDWLALLQYVVRRCVATPSAAQDVGIKTVLRQLEYSYRTHFPEFFPDLASEKLGKRTQTADPEAKIREQRRLEMRDRLEKTAANNDDPSEPTGDRNVIEALMDHLGLRRFLTLNYDVEVEREILRRIEGTLPEDSVPFRTLCDRKPTKRVDPKRITIEDGTRRQAVSATLDSDSISELIGFAALSDAYEYQIFHLHGRIDDPDNLVLTQQDYRRVYMRDGPARNQFEEVQEVLFGGNPILFIGSGVSEADVLQPLRRFVSRTQIVGSTPRMIFALLPSDYEDNRGFKDRLAAIQRSVNYDVNTIYYGGERYKKLRTALNTIDDALSKDDPFDYEHSSEPSTLTSALDWIRRPTVDPRKTLRGQERDLRVPELLLSPEEIDTLSLLCSSKRRLHGGRLKSGSAGRIALQTLVREISGRVQTRALIAELKDIRCRQGEWWDEWRRPPGERTARPVALNDGSDRNAPYLWVRHCPTDVDVNTDLDGFLGWTQIQAARSLWQAECKRLSDAHGDEDEGAPKRPGQGLSREYHLEPEGRRMLRLTIPRGGGAGSFIRQIMPKNRHSLIFSEPSEDGVQAKPVQYKAAFIAHLSYSMEFNSVISALTRFLARRVASIQVALKKGEAKVCIDAELNKERSSHAGPKNFDPKRRWAELQQRFIDSRESEPRLVEFPSLFDESGLGTEERRPHRLDVLMGVLKTYRAVIGSEDERVFVCLSGLDLLCDENGDAYNPSHRAFFRLLSGVGIPDPDAISAPLDLVFVSGTPQTPVCYLSEEMHSGQALKPEEEKTVSRLSRTKRVLHRWGPLRPVAWMERMAFIPIGQKVLTTAMLEFVGTDFKPAASLVGIEDSETRRGYGRCYRTIQDRQVELLTAVTKLPDGVEEPEDAAAAAAMILFITWATQVDGRNVETVVGSHPQRTLIRLLWDNLALSNWVAACWLEKVQSLTWDNQGSPGLLEQIWPYLEEFVTDLDRATGPPSGFERVLKALLKHFRALDSHGARPAREFEVDSSIDPELMDLLLRHLALFALPIEPAVLLDCPVLLRRVDALARRTADTEGARVNQLIAQDPDDEARELGYERVEFRRRRIRRLTRLRLLRNHLNKLVQRRLVIRVHPSTEHENGQTACVDESDDRYDRNFIHWRFAVHARIRAYFAGEMDLSLRDRGDRNHFQVTLFFDQPRDLPTPSSRHFEMVQGILESHISSYRKALQPAYAFSQIGSNWRAHRWDEGEPRGRDGAARELVRMLYEHCEPEPGSGAGQSPDLEIGLYDVHAVAQRLRGTFSLLRGTFSLPSISRLDFGQSGALQLSPFETYAAWLRSMLNAAIGVDVNSVEMRRALTADMFHEDHGPKDVDSPGTIQIRPVQDNWTPPRVRTGENMESLRNFEWERRKDAKATIDRAARRIGYVQGDNPGSGDPTETLKTIVPQRTSFRSPRNPFYRDEIGWLYNELGLTLVTQAVVVEALPLFDRARFVMTHQSVTPESDTHAYHATERRITLNQAVAMIEVGELAEARRILEQLEVGSAHVNRSAPSQTTVFARAYLALCDHMAGSLERAETGYRQTLRVFNRRRQLRAVSIFNRHLADLHRLRDKFDDAKDCASLAVTAASQAEQKDIQQLSRVSLADISLRSGDHVTAGPLISTALVYAQKMKLFRLEAEALIVHARLMIERGEVDRAGTSVSRALAICLAGGLRLRKLTALHLQAQVSRFRGDEALAQRLILETKAEAEQIGYQTLAARLADVT